MIKKDIKFDKEENEIIDAIEKDTLVSLPVSKQEMKDLKLIAQNTFAKTRSINIRISERDLLRLKAHAAREGLPYQTFISSILHKNTTQQE